MLGSPNKKISFLVAVILVMVVIILIDCSHDGKNSQLLNSWKNVALKSQTETKLWKNQAGLSRAQAEAVEADREVIEAAYGDLVRDLKKQLDIKIRQLQSVSTITTTTGGEVKTVTKDSLIYIDTTRVKAKVFQFRDRWVDLNGYFLRDSLSLQYKFYDSLTLATSWKRKNIFANRELQIDAISANPHSSITGLRTISVKSPVRSRVSIGPFVGVGVNGKPVVGVGVQYGLIRF